MQIEVVLSVLGAFVTSLVLTGMIRRLALRHGMLDIPNERSSHLIPTPRGGGVAIVVGASGATIALTLAGIVPLSTLVVLVVGGAVIALVGFFDDRMRLSARVRLAVHFGAAGAAMYWIGGLPPMQVGERLVTFGWDGYLLGVLGIVWSLNLFNFMDGIDGIAASEGAFMMLGGAAIALATGTTGAVPAVAICIGVACIGFLLWNWPPAKIFMGDAGSGYVGYVLAIVALLAAREVPTALLVWVILGGVFFVDATVTLVRRVARGERFSQAHRSHAYQWLARRWGSHRPVTLLVLGINVLWLFPCAYFAAVHPHLAGWAALTALLPLFAGACIAGAGRDERTTK